MAHIPSEFKNLISLDECPNDDTSGETTPQNGTLKNTGTPLDSAISRLKAQNMHKLQQQWENIIRKYLEIDDNTESDEIDLWTGNIIVDNGHLRSFTDDRAGAKGTRTIPSIWDAGYRFESELRKYKHAEEIRRRLRHEEQERLKASSKFHNKRMHMLDLGTRVLPDNLLLLRPSPTKEQKTNTNCAMPLECSSPIKYGTNSLSCGRRLSTPISSQSKEKLPSLASSPGYDNLEITTRNSPQNRNNRNYNFNDHENLESHPDIRSGVENLHDDKEYRNILDTGLDEYDELILLTQFCEHLPVSFFQCAFNVCRYTSNSKASYRAHLLSMHSTELRKIGYPVQCGKQHASFISGDSIQKLNIHFPTKIESPPKKPYVCGQGLASGKCNKIFIDHKHFSRHLQQRPKLCSMKRQVLACPLLGCDFMTDDSYHEFYSHIKSHDNTEVQPMDDKQPRFNCHDNFLDDTSNITFSDYQKGNHCEQDLLKQPQQMERQYSPRKLTERQKIANTALENVPKLIILDSGFDFDVESEIKGDEQGYSSIDELFQNDT